MNWLQEITAQTDAAVTVRRAKPTTKTVHEVRQAPTSGPISVGSLDDWAKHVPASVASKLKSITIADTLPRSQANEPTFTHWTTRNAVTHGYRANTWVFACNYRIAKAVASVPWMVGTGDPDEDFNPITGKHPLKELIRKPNPTMSRQDYMELLSLHLHLAGNCIQTKIRPRPFGGVRQPAQQLWIINPDVIKPVPTKGRSIVRDYEWNVDGVKKRIRAFNVVHQKFTDPMNPYWGMANLEPGGRAVDTDRESSNWAKHSLENRAVASGVFTYKFPMSQSQFDQAVDMIQDQYQGAENAWIPWVLGNDATWQQMSLSPVDMDYIKGRQFSREEICAAFGVPPPMVGIYDQATLANIETARLIFWLDTVIPLLTDIRDRWNLDLAPDFGEDIRLQYDLTRVEALTPLFRQKIDLGERAWRMGVPFKDVNARLGLGFSEFPGWDVSYVQNRFVAVGPTGVPVNSEEPEPEEDEDDQLEEEGPLNGAALN